MDDFDMEPTAADLDAIKAEWPVIEAELAVLDAEIRALVAPSPLDHRRLRRARRRLLVAVAQHSARIYPTDSYPMDGAA